MWSIESEPKKEFTWLLKTWDYMETEWTLEAKLSVPISFPENRHEPRGDRRKVTRFGPWKGRLAHVEARERKVVGVCAWWTENRGGWERSCVCGLL
jgi:hypothetical protein